MKTYCLKKRKDTESKNPRVIKKRENNIFFFSKCPVYNKKLRFKRKQEASGLLS